MFRSLLCCIKQPERSWSCFLSTLLSSHAVVNLGRFPVSRIVPGAPWHAQSVWQDIPPETMLPSDPCSSSNAPCTGGALSALTFTHPLHRVLSLTQEMLRKKHEEMIRPQLQTAIAFRAKLALYQAKISCSSTPTVLENLHRVG